MLYAVCSTQCAVRSTHPLTFFSLPHPPTHPRVPSAPVAELVGHVGALNGIVWAPHSSNHICTCGDDKQALIWDITTKQALIEDPILAFSADEEINQLSWDSSHEDWVAICFSDHLQVLKV
jgi:WD repeat-containing protein 68